MAHKEFGPTPRISMLTEHISGLPARNGDEALQQLICKWVTPALPSSLVVTHGSGPISLAQGLALVY